MHIRRDAASGTHTMHKKYRHITQTPDVLGGEPRIQGTRVSVLRIVELHHDEGLSVQKIAEEWQLPPEAVEEALRYAQDHPDEIRMYQEEHDRAFETLDTSIVTPPPRSDPETR